MSETINANEEEAIMAYCSMQSPTTVAESQSSDIVSIPTLSTGEAPVGSESSETVDEKTKQLLANAPTQSCSQDTSASSSSLMISCGPESRTRSRPADLEISSSGRETILTPSTPPQPLSEISSSLAGSDPSNGTAGTTGIPSAVFSHNSTDPSLPPPTPTLLPQSPMHPPRCSLPDELWLEIFHYATYIPQSRSLYPPDPFDPVIQPNYAWGVNTLTASYKTKCSLVLVCKDWRRLALEILWEYVRIFSVKRADRVLRALSLRVNVRGPSDNVGPTENVEGKGQDSTCASPTHSNGHDNAQYIRHLYFRTPSRLGSSKSNIEYLKQIWKIICLCDNIQFLSCSYTDHHPVSPYFLSAIAQRCTKLEGLRWEEQNSCFGRGIDQEVTIADTRLHILTSQGVLSKFFLGTPAFEKLKILDLRIFPPHALPSFIHDSSASPSDLLVIAMEMARLPTEASSIADMSSSKPLINLPYLTTLNLPATPTLLVFASKLSLPRLERLTLDASCLSSTSYTAPLYDGGPSPLHISLLAFLRVHGPSIQILELIPPSNNNSISGTPAFQRSPEPLSPGMFLQPGICPRLKELVFDCREKPIRDVGDSGLTALLKSQPRRGATSDGPTTPATAACPSKRISTLSSLSTSTQALQLPADPHILTTPHDSLERIGIRGLGISRLYPNKATPSQEHLTALLVACMKPSTSFQNVTSDVAPGIAGQLSSSTSTIPFISNVNDSLLPSLTSVHTLDFLVGTSTDPNARDIFIWWTEEFDKRGVDLLDGECVLWLYEEEVEQSKDDEDCGDKKKSKEKENDNNADNANGEASKGGMKHDIEQGAEEGHRNVNEGEQANGKGEELKGEERKQGDSIDLGTHRQCSQEQEVNGV